MNLQTPSIKSRSSAILNVYLLLEEDTKVLLSLRKNTGYYDGYHGLVSGHVEDGESATFALIREAREEIGISILPEDLKVVHFMHRKTDRNNIDIFFACHLWDLEIVNKEPEKCADLGFYPINALPTKIIPYISSAIDAYRHHLYYHEEGY